MSFVSNMHFNSVFFWLMLDQKERLKWSIGKTSRKSLRESNASGHFLVYIYCDIDIYIYIYFSF